MGKFQQERDKFTKAAEEAGKKIEAGYVAAEGKADEIVEKGEAALAKAKKSKWTAAMLVGATVAGAVAAFYIIK